MKNNKIENSLLIFILIRGIFLLFFNKLSIIEILLSGFLAFILIIIYQKLNIKKNKVLSLILLIIFTFVSSYMLNKISFFIVNNIIKTFSPILISITLIILGLYLIIQGYHAYIKTIELSTYILVIFTIFSLIFLIPYINLNNLNYLLSIKIFTNLNFFNLLCFSLLIFLTYAAINYLNNYQINYKIYSFSIIYIIFIKLFIISILSKTLEDVFNYPYISIFKKVSYFDFFERIESFFSLQFLFDYFFLLTLFLLTIKFIIFDLFNIKKNSRLNITICFILLIIFVISTILQ